MVDPRAIYAVFSPSPLTADQTDLYVDFDKVRGSTGVVPILERHIRLASGSTSQVLAGHKGTGKSTELFLLKRSLQTDEPKFFVVTVRSDDELDRNDVDFPELLIAIIRQIALQLREAGIEVKDGWLKDRFDWLKSQLLKQIDLGSVELNAGFSRLSIALKGSPDARRMVREHLDPDTGNWLTAANELIRDAELQLDQRGYAGLVVLVDDLDKMVVRQLSDGHTTASYLFVNRAAQLTGFACHTVYTIPLSLAYSHHEATIRATFGGDIPVVPMVKTVTAPPDSKPYRPGIDRMKKMVEVRLDSINVKVSDVFGSRVLNAFAQLSGGQPDDLMQLIRSAMARSSLPLPLSVIDRVRIERQREAARFLRYDHWPVIEHVRKTGLLPRTSEYETINRELLDSRAVLLYVNDKEWYGLNPMVAALPPPPGFMVQNSAISPGMEPSTL